MAGWYGGSPATARRLRRIPLEVRNQILEDLRKGESPQRVALRYRVTRGQALALAWQARVLEIYQQVAAEQTNVTIDDILARVNGGAADGGSAAEVQVPEDYVRQLLLAAGIRLAPRRRVPTDPHDVPVPQQAHRRRGVTPADVLAWARSAYVYDTATRTYRLIIRPQPGMPRRIRFLPTSTTSADVPHRGARVDEHLYGRTVGGRGR